jgi:transcriptional regulator with XRE-family HTH domain
MNKAIPFHELLEKHRIEMNISEFELSEKTGLTLGWIYDLEKYNDEYSSNLQIGVLKKLCHILKLNFAAVVSEYCGPIQTEFSSSNYLACTPKDIVRLRRTELNLTIAEISEAVGFEESSLEKIENDDEAIFLMNLDFLRDFVKVLKIPPLLLLFH